MEVAFTISELHVWLWTGLSDTLTLNEVPLASARSSDTLGTSLVLSEVLWTGGSLEAEFSSENEVSWAG